MSKSKNMQKKISTYFHIPADFHDMTALLNIARLSTTRDKIVVMSPIIVIPAILYYTGLAYGLILACTCWATHHIAYHLGYLNEELFKQPPQP